MFIRTETLVEKKLVGKNIITCLANNNNATVFKSFMPHVKNISNRVDNQIISMQVYMPNLNLATFTPHTNFEKWAACEVTNFENVLEGLQQIIIPSGLYAVFLHKGLAQNAAKSFNYIFTEWLPISNFGLDNRPHFEVLGDKYIIDSSDSEEEIWIPIKPK